ncbi:MAG: ABC transporter ATP-binding protein [Pseudomonadota bacterium]
METATLTPTPTLSVRALVAAYEPGLPIVRGVDLSVSSGEIVTVLGPNGAGKSTFVKALAGLVPIEGGTVNFCGDDITTIPAHRRVGAGLAFVPQTENIFATLTIAENLKIAATALPHRERKAAIEEVMARFPDLGGRPTETAGRLSGGQRQMLAVGRALITRPRVLMLDEPSAGLSPKLVGEVFARLKEIAADGVAVLLVEQNVRAALEVADRAVVLAEGVVRRDMDAKALAQSDDLGALFLGAAPEAA